MLMAAKKTESNMQANTAALMDICDYSRFTPRSANLPTPTIPPVLNRPVLARAEESHTHVQKTINRRSPERRNQSCITQQQQDRRL